MREFIFTVSLAKCEVVMQHIGSKQNRLPDLLSRVVLNKQNLYQFNKITNNARKYTQIPDRLKCLTKEW